MGSMDILEINRLKLRCEIGSSKNELGILQEVLVTVQLFTQAQTVALDDNVNEGVDLKKLEKDIINTIQMRKYYVIETIALDVLHRCLNLRLVEKVTVKVEKPNDFSAVTMSRSINDFPLSIAVICIGSNISPKENVIESLKLIKEEFDLRSVSKVYETIAIGNDDAKDYERPVFYNLACEISTRLDFNRLKRRMKEIENILGRKRDPNNKSADRTIDLDIFHYKTLNERQFEFLASEDLKHLHTIIPLLDIKPNFAFKEDMTLFELVKTMTVDPYNVFPKANDGTNEAIELMLKQNTKTATEDFKDMSTKSNLKNDEENSSDTTGASEKVVIITGGTSKLGRHISTKLHDQGYRLALLVNTSVDYAEAMVKKFNDIRAQSAIYLTCNFAEAKQSDADIIIENVVNEWQRVDLLINNASVFETSKYNEKLGEQYRQLQQVNALFPLLLVNSSKEHLERSSGSVINICDIHTLRPLSNHIAYCTSKASLVAITKSLAKDLAENNIRVNGINVGAIYFMEGKDSEDYKQAVISKIPMARLGSPDNITKTVIFLASNDYITGQVINVDGGRTLNQ